jgi:CHAT domain-containing protein/Flp pilus assembly protein TadD
MNRAENQQAREYLLGTVSEAVAEQVELRLLMDPEYAAEFEMLVDEITAEYVEGKFEGEELEQVEKVFFKSAARQEKLTFALALKRVQSERRSKQNTIQLPSVRKRTNLNVYWPIAAGVLIVLGVGALVWRSLHSGSETGEALVALNTVYQDQRPVESRISGLNYAPFSTTRTIEEERNSRELQRAELTLLNALHTKPTSDVRHALGRVYLAKKQFDDAIKEFDEALKTDPDNAVLYSDLGAAWLEKGKIDQSRAEAGNSVEDFARSLEKLDRALELNPNLLEALFNRAVVNQYLMLQDDAERDWQEYLKRDQSSGWADDARRYLKTLQEQKRKPPESNSQSQSDLLVPFQTRDAEHAWQLIRYSRHSSPPQQLIRDQLIDKYLQTSGAGDENEAQKLLQALMFSGEIEFKNTGDVYTSELAQFYASTAANQRAVLIEARRLMALGQSYHNQSKPADALPLFEQANQMFRQVGDPWEADVAELWIGYSHLNMANTEKSIGIFSQLSKHFESKKYRWLHMRALHLLSGAEYNFSEYSKAIDHNQRSRAIAEEIGDSRAAFNALSILVEQYRYIGNYDQALDCVQRSLALLNSCGLDAKQIGQYFSTVAAAFSSAGLNRAAAAYQEEALKTALTIGHARTISRAYANLGIIYGNLGRYDEALQQANKAYEVAKSLPDENVRKGMMAYSSQRVGDLYLHAGNISTAIKSYTECLDLYKSVDNYYGLYEANKSLLLSYISEGNDLAAGEQLKRTLNLIEEYRSQILEDDNRNNFFGIEQSVYDLAIDFEHSRMKNSENAFAYSEVSRARSLLDLVNSNDRTPVNNHHKIFSRTLSQPLSLAQIQEQMPDQAQLVQYSVLNDKLLIWFISKTTMRAFEKQVTQEELQRTVTDYLASVSRSSASDEHAMVVAKKLFEYLIKPVESLLEKDRVIYFVPDKVLNYLPFAALVSPDSNRYLIQDYATGISPSATLFIDCANAAKAKQRNAAERILTVGNPTFSSSYVPALADLPAAKREAEEVARFYNSRSVLTNENATKQAVELLMGKANVIHMAVHSVMNPRFPMRSRLVLAERADHGSEDLEAQDIYKLKLAQTRLVVLSACESGIGKYYGGEGMMSLARPFLAASVPLVVVGLWPVDSDSTAELMIRFHRYRTRGDVSSVEALRQAQLDLLNSDDSRSRRVSSWAPFVSVGGWARF